MPTLTPNVRAIAKAIAGSAAVYGIERHERLYLDVRGGGKAAWRIRYRPKPMANQRWFTIAEDARNTEFEDVALRAKALLNNLQVNGVDPHDTRPEARPGERTVTDCFNTWLQHNGKRRTRTLAPNTKRGYENLFKLHIEPHLGKTALPRLDRKLVEATVAKVRDKTTDAARNFRGIQSTKVLKLLSSMCEWAFDQDWIERNPCRGIENPVPIKHPDGKQSRPPSNAELRQLWTEAPNVMTAAQIHVLKLAILTGRRISEVSGIERSDIRLDQSIPCLFIPATREGNKPKRDDAVPLAPLARAVIDAALAQAGDDTHLFPGATTRWTTSKAVTTLRRVWKWPDPPVRFHDFRGLINDQMAAMSVPTELRSRTLHHTSDLQQLANTVYSAFDFMGDRLKALELWETRLVEIVEDRKPSGLRW
jgi:integrase